MRVVYAVVLCALAPLLGLIAACIAFADGRPVLFTQPRLGLRREPFVIYKFRTMTNGKITRLGRWLRATGLDELPQLWNMVRGDMALVGPRPLTQADVLRLGWGGDFYALRWAVRPGLTGLAQLSPRCHRKFSWVLDRYYVHNRSWGVDACCVVRTACVPFLGKTVGKTMVKKIGSTLSKKRRASA
jgi:lipopolysaccharide/colanic/teichoic acid biosynthesis glycosyltransferase